MDILLLPEIVIKILFFLDTKEICQKQFVCKDWYNAMNESYMQQGVFFWRKICTLQCIREHGNIRKEPIFFFQDNTLEREISALQWKKLARDVYCKSANMNQKLKPFALDTSYFSGDDLWESDDEVDQLPRYVETNTTDSNSSSVERKFDPSQFSNDSSLVLRGVWASTVDHKSQDVNQTRYGLDGYLSSVEHTFWSSEGSKSTNSNDYCIYLLKNQNDSSLSSQFRGLSFLIVDKLKLQPFMASWQDDNIYPSDKVSISIGVRCRDTEDEQQPETCRFDLYTSEEFPVKKEYTYQSFEIGPIILVGRKSGLPLQEQLTQQGNNTPSSTPTYHFETSKKRKMEKTDRQDAEEEEEEQLLFRHRDILHDAFVRFGSEITPELRNFVATRMKQRLNDLNKEKLLKQQTGVFQVRLNFIGKNQKQPDDNLYYTCVEFVDITGSLFEI